MSKHIPNHLSHTPVIKIENYETVDGKYENNTDAKGLSLGFSQWGDHDISAKVWRHTGEQWSPQSEELPLHRIIDLAILICEAYESVKNSSIKDFENQDFEKPFLKDTSIEIAKVDTESFIKFAHIFRTDLNAIEGSGRFDVLYEAIAKIKG